MIKQIVSGQYQSKMAQVFDIKRINKPKEGWIRTLRKALGMSSPQLAKRIGVGKAQASQMERMEMEDRITLKQLRRVADELDCDLLYALVPRKPVESMVWEQARKKAKNLVKKTDVQMKLEAQQLSDERLKRQIDIETERLIKEMPRDLWEND